MQDRIYDLIVEKDEISWKSLLMDIFKKEGLDPWDVDIGALTNSYIQRVKELQETNLKLSGKVLLASALLLKIKSRKLVGEDLDNFDNLLSSTDEMDEDEFYDGLESELRRGETMEDIPDLAPRLPLPRKRKVSVHDLVKALEQALEVKQRRILRDMPAPKVEVPEKKFDITQAIKNLHLRIVSLFSAKKSLKFKELLPSDSKEDKIFTFMPLLHLATNRKIDIEQEKPFGEIDIKVIGGKDGTERTGEDISETTDNETA